MPYIGETLEHTAIDTFGAASDPVDREAAELSSRTNASRLDWAILFALGIAIAATNKWFTAVDDEVSIIGRAAAPVSSTIHLFLSGAGQHEHPPLYDILLHGWLRLTNGSIDLVRVPATAFYLAGIWCIARTARELGGRKAQVVALTLAVLSPYGFHFGRVGAWYSFCFLLVALETLLYLRYQSHRTGANWAFLLLCSLGLVYSNYFGWALLGLLAIDFLFANRKQIAKALVPIVGMGVLLIVAFLPMLVAFTKELHKGVRSFHPLSDGLMGIYVLYAMFVSESVAPWFWILGVPAAVAVAIAIILTVANAPQLGRRLLLYFFAALVAMSAIGVVSTKRALMIAPWLILPAALAFASVRAPVIRRVFAAVLILVCAIGWFGIFDRHVYAAPHWVEPWSDVAQQAAKVVRNGGVVIGNNESFFFYLTYLLPPDAGQPGDFGGVLPDEIRRHGVYDPEQWIGSRISTPGPRARNVMLAKGLHYGTSAVATDETQHWLDQTCRLSGDQLMVHDFGVGLKLESEPTAAQTPWRVEVRSYTCP
jgi:hypothetical protein